MSKKKPRSSPQSKAGHPAKSSTAGNIVSIDEFRARTSGDDLSSQFLKWLRANAPLLVTEATLPVLHSYLALYKEEVGNDDYAVLQTPAMKRALLRFVAEIEDRDFEFTLQTVMGYLLFLGDSGLWSGTDAQFDEAQELVLEFLDVRSDAEFDEGIFDVPALSFKQTRKALLALPLANHLQSFFEWFGTGRDVTSTGILTRKDIEGASAALGIAAVGVATDPSVLTPPAGQPLRVTSARDVTRLHLLWDALVQLGLLELSASRAKLLDPFTDDDQTSRDKLLMTLTRDVALTIYQGLVDLEDMDDEQWTEDDDSEADNVIGIWMTTLLLEAGMGEGYPADSLESTLAAVSGTDQADLLTAKSTLSLLAAEGLIDIGNHYRIPPVLKKIVAFAIAEPSGIEIDYEDEMDEELGYLGAEA